jgi:hypothetical protein
MLLFSSFSFEVDKIANFPSPVYYFSEGVLHLNWIKMPVQTTDAEVHFTVQVYWCW